MSSLIKLLPDNIANQIAAGEVIQRPASVVKEIVENAIDAGAMKIDVNIKDAGKTLIQIVDNGQGMSPEDAELCFQRHATSKVRTAEDLFALTTKGFRGEALASVAAIAHVELKTKQKGKDIGTSIIIEGSTIKESSEATCPVGTSFEVKNLFYNVPARRNFLKSDKVEFGHIADEFERVALSHPDIHFTLRHNDTELYNLQDTILRKRIIAVLGKKSNDRLVPIEESTEIVEMKGFVLKPEFSRKTRGEQFLFVNNRYFKSHYFNHAVNKAFEGLIKEKTFPGFFLYLNVDPKRIDVNVHPTKTEIKFEEEKYIYSIILSSIRLALGKYNIAPTLDFDREMGFDIPHKMHSQPAEEPTIRINKDFNPFQTSSRPTSSSSGKTSKNFSEAIVNNGFGNKEAKQEDWENFYTVEDKKEEEIEELIEVESIEENITSFIVKGNYILSPSKSGLMVIHSKRAVEQIVYSGIIKAFISNPIESQKILFPIEKELSKKEIINWESNASMLRQLGFEGTVEMDILSVIAVPNVLEEETLSSTLDSILETLGHKDIEKGDIAHSLVASIARSASMKQLNLNTNEAIQGLINQLFQCENHMFTPSNKKIIDTIDLELIETKFK
ncbi:MAG: DNA mismatch repair endonuclease MutL [Crocinitomicaceae bacterium]|nr:DNA mismatch repair endonuclease MutL [Crocinitomicaceae bacterium]